MATAATNHAPGFQIDVISVRVPTRPICAIDLAGAQFSTGASLGAQAIRPRREAQTDCRYVSFKVMVLSVPAHKFFVGMSTSIGATPT